MNSHLKLKKGVKVKKVVISLFVVLGLSVSAVADKFGYECVGVSVENIKTNEKYEFSKKEISKQGTTGFIYDSYENGLVSKKGVYKYYKTSNNIRIYRYNKTLIYIPSATIGDEYQFVWYQNIDKPNFLFKNICKITPF
jgi:hypothetical protein